MFDMGTNEQIAMAIAMANWIYEQFSIERRISGYYSDRYISKTDFIKAIIEQCPYCKMNEMVNL